MSERHTSSDARVATHPAAKEQTTNSQGRFSVLLVKDSFQEDGHNDKRYIRDNEKTKEHLKEFLFQRAGSEMILLELKAPIIQVPDKSRPSPPPPDSSHIFPAPVPAPGRPARVSIPRPG